MNGWEHNRDASYHYGANFQMPSGETLDDAETVIYARAIYKPRVPETKSLEELILKDINKFQKRDPRMQIIELDKENSKNNLSFRPYKLVPDKGLNWEIVSFSEETDFYLLFVLKTVLVHQHNRI